MNCRAIVGRSLRDSRGSRSIPGDEFGQIGLLEGVLSLNQGWFRHFRLEMDGFDQNLCRKVTFLTLQRALPTSDRVDVKATSGLSDARQGRCQSNIGSLRRRTGSLSKQHRVSPTPDRVDVKATSGLSDAGQGRCRSNIGSLRRRTGSMSKQHRGLSDVGQGRCRSNIGSLRCRIGSMSKWFWALPTSDRGDAEAVEGVVSPTCIGLGMEKARMSSTSGRYPKFCVWVFGMVRLYAFGFVQQNASAKARSSAHCLV